MVNSLVVVPPFVSSLLEYCPTSAILADKSFSILYGNKALTCLTKGADPFIGKQLDHLITPLDTSKQLCLHNFFESPLSAYPPITSMLRVGDKHLLTELLLVKVEGEEGNELCCCYVKEVDHQKDLVVQTEREACILNSSLDAVVQSDANLNVIGWNTTAEKVFGWSEQEIVGKPLMALLPEMQTQTTNEPGLRSFFTRKEGNCLNQKVESQGLRKDGSKIPVELSISSRTFANGMKFFSAFVRDLSQEKILENATKLVQSITVANEAKNAFISTVSHELRSPLNAIFGFSQLLNETQLSIEQHDCVSSIISASEGLIQLVSDLADLSKIEAQKVQLNIKPFVLPRLVTDAVNSGSLLASTKHIALASFMSPHLPQNVVGDASRLKQIIVNLVNNALKFTPEDGSVVVNVVSKCESSDVVELLFQVRDTGCGIAQEDMCKLFKRFSQLTPGKACRGGSGLGLSICAELARLMGGSIGVNSEGKGRGSTFWFTCKLSIGNINQRVHKVPPMPPNCSVMIAYNNLHVASSLSNFLCEMYNLPELPQICSSLTEVLHNLQSNPSPPKDSSPSLIIIDEDIPEFDSMFNAIKSNCNSSVNLLLVKNILSPKPTTATTTPPPSSVNNTLNHVNIVQTNNNHTGGNNIVNIAEKLVYQCTDYLFSGPKFKVIRKPLSFCKVKSALDLFGVLKEPRPPIQRRNSTPTHVFIHASSCSPSVTCLSSSQHVPQACILVAEDNPLNFKITQKMLSTVGYDCEQAVDGRDVIDRLDGKSYNCILMDCQMPVMDGYVTTKRIRELEQNTQHIPIIAMTANAMYGDRERCLATGMDDYLSKPFSKQKLIDIVEKWITPQQFMLHPMVA